MITVPTPTPEAAKQQAEKYRRCGSGTEFEVIMAAAIELGLVSWDENPDMKVALFALTEKGAKKELKHAPSQHGSRTEIR